MSEDNAEIENLLRSFGSDVVPTSGADADFTALRGND